MEVLIMAEVTISSKFQVVIPKELRQRLDLKAGKKMQMIVVGETISIVPVYGIEKLKGRLKGMDITNIRE
jgi:AbrB family looped-hinge helix DNA binding protein